MQNDDDLWDADAFTKFGIALHGDTRGWAVALAERLGVQKRVVHRWSSEGAPLRIKLELLENVGIIDETALVWPRDRWICAEGPLRINNQPRRQYVMHTQFPRFIARIIMIDEDSEEPDPIEHPADLNTGAVYHVDRDTVLAEINWIDAPPREKYAVKLLEEAGDFFEELA